MIWWSQSSLNAALHIHMFSVPFAEFSQTYVQDCVTYWYNAKERSFGQQKRKAYCKAAFPLLYILIVNILSANNI